MRKILVLFAVLISAIIAAPAAQASPLGRLQTRADASAQAYGIIVNRNSGRCLEVENSAGHDGARAQQWACVGQPGAQWQLEWVSNTEFILRNRSGKCLEIENSWGHNGAPAQQWACVGQSGAYWHAFVRPDGWLFIVNRSGKCLEIENSNPNDGARAQQWTCEAINTMQWR
ncbi:RICIN domain-containing protein [Lentzea sp. NPDC051213]|uniref:RICIN domain-containing protein n=1 Tax=Lentzea sp. NPDC051213 TaxID=3364126 RepID=UPI00379364DB